MTENVRQVNRHKLPLHKGPIVLSLPMFSEMVACQTVEHRTDLQYDYIDTWFEEIVGDPVVERTFVILATGDPIKDGWSWVGSCLRSPAGYVWHVYEDSGRE